MKKIKALLKKILPLIDKLILPFVYAAAWLLKKIRRIGVQRLPASKNALLNIGVFPIRDHFYEPLFHPRHITKPLSNDRNLPGIDWNVDEQLNILGKFHFNDELSELPEWPHSNSSSYLENGSFASGDAEYWYNIIRLKKPERIYEVGSGNSTLIAIKAIEENKKEDSNYSCEHVCIEPYSNEWLEDTSAKILRKKVEDVDLKFFSDLTKNDILFIDSSHIIRPQGDVLTEYLKILPSLKTGVIVHSHDIFSPKDYLESWVIEQVRFWNEQYLLEAFLTHNSKWKVIGALNFLHHNHYDSLKEVCPYLTNNREPGSFYMQKTSGPS